MAEVVKMPQLGESVTEGTIGQWLKQVGDSVDKYESILEVQTDKVNAEVPAPIGGVITKLLVKEGETVPVGTPICEMESEESVPVEDSSDVAVSTDTSLAASPVESSDETVSENRGRYSPAVRRLAQENGIDPAQVKGSGHQGRVTRSDILQAIDSHETAHPPSTVASSPVQAAPSSTKTVAMVSEILGAPAVIEEEDTFIPVSGVRKVIAERMLRSKQTVPHAWLMVEVDVTGLVNLRNQIKDDFKAREGTNLTYVPFMLRATVEALRKVPLMNAQWNGDQIVMKKRINIGMAAATERGLIVPVIKDADQKNIVGLAKASQDLIKRARGGKLTMADLSGGTFTVDNTGAVGTVLTYPIINAPEVGIVTMESIVARPVVIDNMIAIRSMMNVCLSFDHRVVDGAEAGLFMQTIKKYLESIGPSTSIY